MPSSPKKIKRPWVKVKVMQSRELNMSWFYNDWRWRKFSSGFRKRHPLCSECIDGGMVTPTQVCDHKERYIEKGNGWDLNNLNDKDFNHLCNSHHNKRSGRQAHNK